MSIQVVLFAMETVSTQMVCQLATAVVTAVMFSLGPLSPMAFSPGALYCGVQDNHFMVLGGEVAGLRAY